MNQKLARILLAQIKRNEERRKELGTIPHNCYMSPWLCNATCRGNLHGRIVEMYGLPSTDFLYYYANGGK